MLERDRDGIGIEFMVIRVLLLLPASDASLARNCGEDIIIAGHVVPSQQLSDERLDGMSLPHSNVEGDGVGFELKSLDGWLATH